MYKVNQIFPGIRHITETMGVGFTLIEGSERAVLFDTGYGMEDVNAFIATLTEKPVTVLLSHGHHDHMLGARWFPKTCLCAEDMEEFVPVEDEALQQELLKIEEARMASWEDEEEA